MILDDIRRGEALLRLVLVLALAGVAGWIGYRQGRMAGDAAVIEQVLERERSLNERLGQAVAAGDAARGALQALQQRIAAERRAWKEKLDATTDADLVAQADCPGTGHPPDADAAGMPVLSARFLGLYNDAWCGAGDEQPAAACRAAAQAAGAQAVDPRAVLRHTEDEAAGCREDRARFDQLITTLQQPPWSQKVPP